MRLRPFATLALVLGLVLGLVAACGDDDDGGGVTADATPGDASDDDVDAAGPTVDAGPSADADGDDPLAVYLEAQRTRFCNFQVTCGAYASVEVCLEATPLATQQLTAEIAAGRIIFDPGATAACLAELDARFGTCALSVAVSFIDRDEPLACDAVFTGTVADAGECFDDLECVSRRCSFPEGCDPASCCAGTCAPTPPSEHADVGESCADRRCVSGAFCTRTTKKCIARVAVDAPCTELLSCVVGAACNLSPTTGSGTCKPLAGHEAECDPAVLIPCDLSADYCASGSKTCVAQPRTGETCNSEARCLAHATCVGGECVDDPAAGEPCPSSGPGCQGTLQCEDGTCEAYVEPSCL